MKNKLIPMTEFVLSKYNDIMNTKYNDGSLTEWDAKLFVKYASFLKQPLKLEMFVPCDDDGNVLEEPGSAPIYTHSKEYIVKWQKAKNKVLFEGLIYPNNLVLRKDTEGRSYWLIKFGNERYRMKSENEYNNIIGTVIYCDGNIEQLLGACLTPTAMKMIYGTNI